MSTQATLRVLVAEDDPHQLTTLVSWIGELKPGWQVVATAREATEVVAAIDQYAPDLMVLDIHLPGADGPQWIRNLDTGLPIIFVTGDPDFAVHAFDAAAIDYALKPITMRRLKAALDRADADPRVGGRSNKVGLGGEAEPLSWITMSRGNDVMVVATSEVIYLQADLKYTRIVTERGEGLVRTGITELIQKLDGKGFAKIHRSVVVNLRYVASVKRNGLGHMEVHLIGRDEVLKVSKSLQHVFKTS